MYYEDLSPYSYSSIPDGKVVLNVGWLARSRRFSEGDVTADFIMKLRRLSYSCRVNQTRGTHVCDFCRDPFADIWIWHMDGSKLLLGAAEIWVPSADGEVIYAAPDLIIHYIEKHRYVPPIAFVKAVLAYTE